MANVVYLYTVRGANLTNFNNTARSLGVTVHLLEFLPSTPTVDAFFTFNSRANFTGSPAYPTLTALSTVESDVDMKAKEVGSDWILVTNPPDGVTTWDEVDGITN